MSFLPSLSSALHSSASRAAAFALLTATAMTTTGPASAATPPAADTLPARVTAAPIGWAWVDRAAKDPKECGVSLHVAQDEYEGIASFARVAADDGGPATVPAGDARLPARLTVGGAATVISTRGLSQIALRSFQVYAEEGNTFLTATASSSAAKADAGLVASGQVDPKARLTAPRGKKLAAKEAKAVLEAVLATANEDAREALDDQPLRPGDLRVLDARAPSGARILLAKQRVRAAEGGAPGSFTVGLFLLASDGKLVRIGEQGLHTGSAGFVVPWKTDVNGDGVDELVVRTEWAEGSTSTDVMMWDGTKYAVIGL
jgi:hypothetical protein